MKLIKLAAVVMSVVFCGIAQAKTVFVSKQGKDTNGGTGWDDAKLTIQGGINAATSDDTVLVGPGVYSAHSETGKVMTTTRNSVTYDMPTVVYINKNITLVSANTNRAETIIEGLWDPANKGINGSTFEGIGPKAVRGIYVSGATVQIIGFTIRNCATLATTAENADYDCGAGIAARAGATVAYVYKCDIVNCRAGTGAAMAGSGSQACITVGCRFAGNVVGYAGHVFYRTTYHRNDLFEGNGKGNYYIGTVVAQNEVYVNCTYLNNNIACVNYPNGGNMVQRMYNCAFLTKPASTLETDTTGKSTLVMSNCAQVVSTGRLAYHTEEEHHIQGISKYQYYSPATGDWTPVTGSPLIDAGMEYTNTAYDNAEPVKTWIKYDYAGNPRKVNGAVDIGCIESQGTTKAIDGALVDFTISVDDPAVCMAPLKIGSNGTLDSCSWACLPEKTQHRIARGWTTGEDMFCVEVRDSTAIVDMVTRWPDRAEDQGFWLTTPTNGSAAVMLKARKAVSLKYVKADYTGGDSDGSHEKPYTDINLAISNSATYGVIKVMPGVYDKGYARDINQDPNIVTSRVTVVKNIAVRSTEGAEKTILTGGANMGIFRIINHNTYAQIQGFTLTGVNAPAMEHGAFYNWMSSSFVYNYGSYSRMSDCIVTNNYTLRAAGMFGGWAERCYFADNRTTDANIATAAGAGSRGTVAYRTILSGCVIRPSAKSHDATYETTVLNCTFDGPYRDSSGKHIRAANNISRIFNCALCDSYVDVVNTSAGGLLEGCIRTYGNSEKNDNNGITQYPKSYDYFADAANGDFRPVRGAAGLTKGEWSDKYHVFETGTFDGGALEYSAEAKPYPGAFGQTMGSIVLSQDEKRGAMDTSRNIVTEEDEVVVTAKETTHPYLGYVLNGTTNLTANTTIAVDTSTAGAKTLEVLYGKVLYVDPTKSDANNGFTAETAKKTLVGVITNTVDGDIVYAAEGTYNEGEMTNDAVQVVGERVAVPAGVSLIASGRRDQTIIYGRWHNESTGNRYYTNADGCKALRCVRLNARSLLEGFTVKHGSGTGWAGAPPGNGKNDASTSGGCVFGPAPTSDDTAARVRNCVLAEGGGRYAGGVYGCIVENCHIYDNAVSSVAGSSYMSKLINCVISNTSSSAVQNHYGIYNSTIYSSTHCERNEELTRVDGTRGVYNSIILVQTYPSSAKGTDTFRNLKNCLFYPAVGYAVGSSDYNGAFANIAMDSACANVITQDVAGCKLDASRLFEPLEGSPAIDAGDRTLVSGMSEVMAGDYDGSQRVYNGEIDIGAHEYDWRAKYREVLKYRRILEVALATENVVENEAGSPKTLTVGGGERIVISVKEKAAFFANFAISGAGKLEIFGDDGVRLTPVAGLKAGDTRFEVTGQDEVTLAYTGEGAATLKPFTSSKGLAIMLK